MVSVGSKPDVPIGTYDEQRNPVHVEERDTAGIETNAPVVRVGGKGGDGDFDKRAVDAGAHQRSKASDLVRAGTGAPHEESGVPCAAKRLVEESLSTVGSVDPDRGREPSAWSECCVRITYRDGRAGVIDV
jgi:hypothetical protein